MIDIGAYIMLAICILTILSITIFVYIRRKRDIKTNHFSVLYTNRKYNTIVGDSNLAGKWNSPFIEQDDILTSISNGTKLLSEEATVDNLFISGEDYDERPKW